MWGEQDVIIDNESLRQNLCARALNFLEVFAIDRPHLEAVTDAFPEVARRIRRVAVRLAARRAFIRYAKEVLQERTGRKQTRLTPFPLNRRARRLSMTESTCCRRAPAAAGPREGVGRLEGAEPAGKQQHDLATVAQLTQSVKQLRDDLIPEGQQASRKD